ncbi:MAG: type II toxin-antitoxin system prevent-host-death family antitoxin [Mariprofundus sp.]
MNVAVRELKDHLSEYLSRAAAGEELVITSHGKPTARLLPLATDGNETAAIDRLRAQPWIIPARKSGKPEGAAHPIPWKQGEKMLSELMLDDRG